MDIRQFDVNSNIVRIALKNSSTGVPLTGLDHTSTGLIISTILDNEATATAYTVASSNVETITTLGTFAAPTASKCRFKAVDATNHPGLYEIQIADARFSVASSKVMTISVSGATNLLATDYQIMLVGYDPFSALATPTNITAGTITTATNVTTVNGLAANVITATSIQNDAITDAKVASDVTIASVTGAVGSVTGAVGSVTAGVTVTTNNDKTGYALTTAYDFAKGTVAMTESYAANGVAPTPIQAIYAIQQYQSSLVISGTSYSVKKLDHLTEAYAVTLDDATSPTSALRL